MTQRLPRLSAAIALVACALLWAAVAYAALTFPALTGRVVDDAQILSPAAITQLSSALEAHERKTGDQIVVATLKSLQGTAIEDYGYQLGRAWGIGQKGKDNGAILIVVPSERRVRIEVGYGLEGQLTDAASRTIIESAILPAFRRGDFDSGVVSGVAAILRTLGDQTPLAAQPDPYPVGQGRPHHGGFPINLILILVFFVLMGGRGFLWPLLFLGGGRRYGGGYGGGGFSGGGFSGGGFSGGGGSFGGGGASGSW